MLKGDVPSPYMAARQHVAPKYGTRTTRPLGAPREIPKSRLCSYTSGATSTEVAPFCFQAVLAYGRGADVL